MKTTDYTVVVAESPWELSAVVREKLREGWEPQGNPFVTHVKNYAQAMVKRV